MPIKNYQYVVDAMTRNDPNGEYDVESCKQWPFIYLDILQAWYYELKDSHQNIPGWLVWSIAFLDKVAE